MSEATNHEEEDQVAKAARVVLGLLRQQVENPGAIELTDLPFLMLEAAEERYRHGDFGAARMLCDWADMLLEW